MRIRSTIPAMVAPLLLAGCGQWTPLIPGTPLGDKHFWFLVAGIQYYCGAAANIYFFQFMLYLFQHRHMFAHVAPLFKFSNMLADDVHSLRYLTLANFQCFIFYA